MNIFNNLLINVVILLFPIILNLFYLTYNINSNKEESNTFLDFSLLSSLYLFLILNEKQYNFIILLNIPLILSYIKKRGITSIIISIGIVFTYYKSNEYSLLILFIEYLIYYILYLITLKNSKSNNLFLKMFFIFKTLFVILYYIIQKDFCLISFINQILLLITFLFILYLSIYIFKKGEDIIRLHMSIKELENDKQIRTSLFKITHEIKNPIAVCKSYLDMFDFNNEEHARYIPIIQEEIEKILLLLQDFLSMNKIKINKEILDINMLLEDIVNQYEPILNDNNIKFITDVSQDEVFIEGDYNRLSQVLINIIKNSIESFDNKDSFISLKHSVEGSNYKIIIEDNGCGISEDELKKIKEPFYTTKKNGTGLGVSLSCEIIEAHQGNIQYFSKEGEGTKVIITLPLSDLISF